MKKKQLIILVVLALLGSILTFFGTNLLMGDIANYAALGVYIISTFPFLMLVFDVIAITIGYARYIKHNEYKKALLKHYSTLVLIFSSIGLIASILTGTIVYHGFFKPYIFPGYGFIMLIIHLVIIALDIYGKIKCIKGLEEDKAKKKVTGLYVLYTSLVAFLVFYGFNKMGAVLYSPMYVTWVYALETAVFYLCLALPILLVIFLYLIEIKAIKNKKLIKILSIVALACGIGFSVGTIIMGAVNSKLIAAVSMAVPLERLASMPMDSLFVRPIINIGLGITIFIRSKKEL